MRGAIGRGAAGALLGLALVAGGYGTTRAAAADAKTLKERLSDKASDDQRVDNCNVPLARRGQVPRPGCPGEAEIHKFRAIVLICPKAVAEGSCDEATATDVMSIPADSEIACFGGWQDLVARSAFARGVGTDSYIKTLCLRRAE